MRQHRAPAWRTVLALLALQGIALAAHADDQQRAPQLPLLPKYQQECASCHVAYPPGLLPAGSWQRLLGHLPQHFGTDASLDAPSIQELAAWLTANAGTDRPARAAPPGDRITKSGWFVREHDEVPAATWKRASVKSPANCSACHAQAQQGDFNEHDVRIPR